MGEWSPAQKRYAVRPHYIEGKRVHGNRWDERRHQKQAPSTITQAHVPYMSTAKQLHKFRVCALEYLSTGSTHAGMSNPCA